MRNAKTPHTFVPPLFRNGAGNRKMTQNPHPDSYQHQNLTITRG